MKRLIVTCACTYKTLTDWREVCNNDLDWCTSGQKIIKMHLCALLACYDGEVHAPSTALR